MRDHEFGLPGAGDRGKPDWGCPMSGAEGSSVMPPGVVFAAESPPDPDTRRQLTDRRDQSGSAGVSRRPRGEEVHHEPPL